MTSNGNQGREVRRDARPVGTEQKTGLLATLKRTATEFSEAGKKDFRDFIRDWTPARRWGRPEDLCGPAVLLASDAGAYINGQVLYVDGGFLAVTK